MKLQIHLIFLIFISSCQQRTNTKVTEAELTDSANIVCCIQTDQVLRKNLANQSFELREKEASSATTKGMVFIEGGIFTMGARDAQFAREDEYPAHRVQVRSFYMDPFPVTNTQFKKFVDETGYITTAERPVDWEELKKQLPPGTP